MSESVAIAIYANHQGRVSDKGYIPTQLGCAAMVKVWVEKHLIEEHGLDANDSWSVHHTEGRGYLLEGNNIEWGSYQFGSSLAQLHDSVMEFVDSFGLRKKGGDFALEIVTASDYGSDDYSVNRWGSHIYALQIEHTINIAGSLLKPLTLDDSDWIGERG